ncbi:streptophobe family protein [Streptomyces sp. NPDC088763]|uniref:streptophobe family protein n=1 Tax=Streptomyces sp. NPDC088763 TaxID=3365892 RepID=UPI003808D90F
MSASTNVGTSGPGTGPPWGDVLLSAVVSVSWALIGMAGTAALGLHLLGADATASLGPMSAAVVALGAGGSVTPSGDVSAFGLSSAQAATAIDIAPLGVGLVGALLLAWLFLRSLRSAGEVVAPSELLARVGTVTALFVAMLGGLSWAGHDVVTIDGGELGLDDVPGGGGSVEVPGLGDIGGLLPDRIGDLVGAKAAVGFTVDTAPTLLGGLVWCAGVLLIALLASRRTPLPRGWEAVHRVVRPAVSALVTVLLVAVAAGLAAAAYAAVDDAHPKRIAGAALLGAPNGVWLGVPLGLFVPFDGRATGPLTRLLPDPLDDLLTGGDERSVTLGRLAELDGRVWLLGVAAALMMLLAGVLTAVRTPVTGPGDVRDPGAVRFAGRCALRLGTATALALALLVRLTALSADASLSVLGFDAFGASVELRGSLAMALLLGAAWGAGAGAVGALAACLAGTAGVRTAPLARAGSDGGPGSGSGAGPSGPYTPGTPYRPPNPATNPYLRVPEALREPEDARPPGAPRAPGASGSAEPEGGARSSDKAWSSDEARGPWEARRHGGAREPWEARRHGRAQRPWEAQGPGGGREPGTFGSREPDEGAREPGEAREPGQTRRPGEAREPGQTQEPGEARPPGEPPPPRVGDVYGAPTVVRPIEPPRRRGRGPSGRDDGPPPPPPPPGTPKGRR